MSWAIRVGTTLVRGQSSSETVSGRIQRVRTLIPFSFRIHILKFKGFDSSAPIGPVLVAQEQISDPHDLRIKAIHNGNVVQDSSTKEMIFGISEMIAFLSQGTTLERGSLIMTGTPPGIGAMRDPKVVLNHGDDMRVEIEGIGGLRCLFTGDKRRLTFWQVR